MTLNRATLLADVQAMIKTLETNRAYGPYSVTTKDGTFTMNEDGQVHHEPFEAPAFQITKDQDKKLAGFARRLRTFGRTQGTTFLAGVPYEIELNGAGYTVLGVNGFKPEEQVQ